MCLGMWSTLANALRDLDKNVYSAANGRRFCGESNPMGVSLTFLSVTKINILTPTRCFYCYKGPILISLNG